MKTKKKEEKKKKVVDVELGSFVVVVGVVFAVEKSKPTTSKLPRPVVVVVRLVAVAAADTHTVVHYS